MTDLKSQTVLVTGANTGIGKAAVESLASKGVGRIIIASRTKEKTQPVLDALAAKGVETHFIQIELSDLASVKRAADEVLAKDWTIDVLMNNAGIAGVQGITKDGFELAFGTNHLGHYLWTEKLLPLVKRAPQGRIVLVSSEGHYRAPGIDFAALQQTSATFSAFPEYCVSKLCNVLHAKELARRLKDTNVTTYSLHPGGVASDIWQRRMGMFAVLLRPFLITNEKGARTQVYCATDASVAKQSGLYYDKERVKEPSKLANDVALQDELKRKSDEWVAKFVS